MASPRYVEHATDNGLPGLLFTRDIADPEVLGSAPLPFAAAMTAVAFVKPVEHAAVPVYTTQAAMSLLSDNGTGKFSFGIDNWKLKVVFYSTADAAEQVFTTSGWTDQPSLYDGLFHDVGVVISALGAVTFYIDGVGYYAGARTTPGWETLYIDTIGAGIGLADPYGGYFTETLSYNAAKTAIEMAGISEWLHLYWDVSAPPQLVSSTPANSSANNSTSTNIGFTYEAPGTQVDETSERVYIDGVLAYTDAGGFAVGFAGTETTNADYSRTFLFTTRPVSTGKETEVTIRATDIAGRVGYFGFTFGVVRDVVTLLTAKTWCDGKRIDLSWTAPAGSTHTKLRRSSLGYPRFIDDPGTDVYSGVVISAFVDGVYVGALATSNASLEEGKFYYYTVFSSFDGGTTWLHSLGAECQGLSIIDYYAAEGDYVYNLLPREVRRADAAESRGTNRYKQRDYCRVLQCGVNMYRGWIESLLTFRDPDLMPAGRMGDTENNYGILSAQVWDYGLPPGRSLDAPTLRRLAYGLVGLYQKKGICSNLVDLCKIMTTWDSRCDELIESLCGVNHLAFFWDAESSINQYKPTAYAAPTAATQAFVVSEVWDALGTTLNGALPVAPAVAFVLDSLGTFACVASVAAPALGEQTFTYADPAAELRCEITGGGVAGVGDKFTITSIEATSYPWQYPSPAAEPVYGPNAFQGLQLMDSAGTVRTVISSTATTSVGDTTLTLSGALISGVFSLAAVHNVSGSYAGRQPLLRARLFTGEFTLTYDPIWDYRLKDETAIGPWSLITSISSTLGPGWAPTPVDVGVIVQNEHEVLGRATLVYGNALTDSTQAWTINQWKDHYLLPDWNQRKVFKILGNTATELVVEIPAGVGDLDTLSQANSHYVVLTEKNAIRYANLSSLLPSFLPTEIRPFVKFETV